MPASAMCQEETSNPFLRDVWHGLSQSAKTLPTKFFYDKTGSQLFEQICELDEYYLTRTELSIMATHAREMSESIGSEHVVLELGSGASLKTKLLLSHIDRPAAYVPFDISQTALDEAIVMLQQEFPQLKIVPVCGDFMSEIRLPDFSGKARGVVTYFPGSTIGNLNHSNAVALLERIRRVEHKSDLLIGIDLEKDRQILLDAYDDNLGVTAAFNKNLLHRINRELAGNFIPDQFQHQVIYNELAHRIEMYLVSRIKQKVNVQGKEFSFAAGEPTCTEHSHKYSIERFGKLAMEAEFKIRKVWLDKREWFAVILLTPIYQD